MFGRQKHDSAEVRKYSASQGLTTRTKTANVAYEAHPTFGLDSNYALPSCVAPPREK